MAAQSLGTLTIDLNAKTANLQSDMGKAARILDQYKASTIATGVAAGEALYEGIKEGLDKVKEILTESFETFDQYSKNAQKVGIDTTQFSKLAYAAGLSDVSVDDLTSTLIKFDKSQAAANGGNKTMIANFAALGITTKDPIQGLNQLADLFHNLPDSADKTGLAIALLGKSGAQAIPFLNEGSAALKELGDQADAFGLTVDGATGKAAEEFNDNLKKLKDAASGFGAELAKALLPSLVEYTGQMVDGAEHSSSFKDEADGLAVALKGVAVGAAFVKEGIQDITVAIAAGVGNIGKFGAALKAAYNDNKTTGKPLSTSLHDAFSSANFATLGSANSATDSFKANADARAQTVDAVNNPGKPKLPETLDQTSAAAKKAADQLKAFQQVTANQKAADDAEAKARKAANELLKESIDLKNREVGVTNSMADEITKSTDQLYKSDIPGLDAYNKNIQNIAKTTADFTKQDTNRITGVISPADVAQIADYTKKMTALADATLAEARAKQTLVDDTATKDLAAQASDAQDAANGIVGLASATNDYNKQLTALSLSFENGLSIADYTSQLASINTLHAAAVKSISEANDQGLQAVRGEISSLQGSIADALDGEGFQKGIKGFLGGIADALRKAADQFVAADITKGLFGGGATKSGGNFGGLLGGLFSSGPNYSDSSASGVAAAEEAQTSGANDAATTSIFTKIAGLFGGGKAGGGSTSASKGYIVGENGPEWFNPGVAGNITTNSNLRGMSGGQVTNVYVQPTSSRETANQVAAAVDRKQRTATARNG